MPVQTPSYLAVQPNMPELQRYMRGLAGQFNTSGVENNYNQQMQGNVARGQAQSAAAARAAQSRAFRTGGQVAGSFAQGSMMLPTLQANQQMAGDLAQYKGGMQARMSAQQLAAAQAMAQMRMQQTGMRSGYEMDANRLNQQGSQFNAELGQRNSEFGTNSALARDQFGLQSRSLDMQQTAQNFAMQQASMRPIGANYNVDNLGNPMTPGDGMRMTQANGVGYGGGSTPGYTSIGGGYSGGGGMGYARTTTPSRSGMTRYRAQQSAVAGMRGFNMI